MFAASSVSAQKVTEVKTDQTFLSDYVSKQWTTEDGLPGMTITTVMQDKTGYIWIGTDNGVACYKDNVFIENKVTQMTKGYRVRHIGMTADNEILISSYSDIPQICLYPDDL